MLQGDSLAEATNVMSSGEQRGWAVGSEAGQWEAEEAASSGLCASPEAVQAPGGATLGGWGQEGKCVS